VTADRERPLDPADLVRSLNGLGDFDRFPARPRPGWRGVGPGETIAADGCWCGERQGHDWPGRDEGAPHPGTAHEALRRAVEDQRRRADEQIGEAARRAAERGVGVLVLTKRGLPWKCGPWPEVPAGEIHWRAVP
jgi:hypothetical protein